MSTAALSRTEIVDELQNKIKTLNESVWSGRANWPHVMKWMSQFQSDLDISKDEQVQLLFLISHFLFFGEREIRALLRSLYRDHFNYRLIEKVRKRNSDTLDRVLIESEVAEELKKTRFVLVGNPSESSAHLLYYLRQEGPLPKDLFTDSFALFSQKIAPDGVVTMTLKDSTIRHYVFVDDLCGSGDQITEYSAAVVAPLRALNPTASFHYYALFADEVGLGNVRALRRFDVVEAVVALDESFKCFSATSRVYSKPEQPFEKAVAEAVCRKIGSTFAPAHPLGYRDGQLLLGFYHNTPDNTLPVVWWDEAAPPWYPLFRRYPKYA